MAGSRSRTNKKLITTAASLAAIALAAGIAFGLSGKGSKASEQPPAPQAIPVEVATVVQREVTAWDEFSGRLEAVERVELRSRVAGAVQSVHFIEGSLVKRGDL
ncbi:MAG: efflux transporter periplasmic adaptor subunit, partial [Burkholderiales bacterium]